MSLDFLVSFPGLPVASICVFAWGLFLPPLNYNCGKPHCPNTAGWKCKEKLTFCCLTWVVLNYWLRILHKNTPASPPWSWGSSETYVLHYFQGFPAQGDWAPAPTVAAVLIVLLLLAALPSLIYITSSFLYWCYLHFPNKLVPTKSLSLVYFWENTNEAIMGALFFKSPVSPWHWSHSSCLLNCSVGWPRPSGWRYCTYHIIRPGNSWSFPSGAWCSMWGHPSLPNLFCRRRAMPPLQLSSKSLGLGFQFQSCIVKPQNGPGFPPHDSQQKKSRSPSVTNWDGYGVGGGSKEQTWEKQSKRVKDNC